MKNSVLYQPVQKITIKSSDNLLAFRFVGFSGSHCTAGGKSLGVTERKFPANKSASVVTIGTVPVEAVGAISVGDNLASDSQGRAVVATSGAAVNARALESTENGGIIKVMLVP